jgi:ABC-type nitrate/sulfonate/bicarbonate transport system substrate-binding protein
MTDFPSGSALPSGRTLDRRAFLRGGMTVAGGALALGVAPSLLAACSKSSTTGTASPSATAGSKVSALTYQLSWLETSEFGGTYLALDRGYYKANRLDVSILPGGPNVTVAPVVASAKADIGSDNADSVARARLNGAPLKIIGARFQKNPFCIMSRADKPLTSPQQMVGKKIGVAQANQTAFDLLCKINNIDESKINVVPVQFDPTPVATGEVDGQIVFVINEPGQLKTKGVDTTNFLLADFGYNIFADVYSATDDTIAKKPEVLAEFLRAERKGWADDLADPTVGANASLNNYGKSLGNNAQQQLIESQALSGLMVTPTTTAKGLFYMDPADIAKNIATLKTAGIDISASDLFTDKILAML